MSKTVKIRKGLDIKLLGDSERVVQTLSLPKQVAIKPSDFHGLNPKVIVKEGEQVKAGQIIFFDKYNESIKCATPASGTVQQILRGDKRKIMEVIISVDSNQEYVSGSPAKIESLSGEQVK